MLRSAIAIIVIALLVFSLWYLPGWFGSDDLIEYWAAARLYLNGENPYDPVLLLKLQESVRDMDEALMMWNPPIVFPFIAPLGFFQFSATPPVWLMLSLAMLLTAFSYCRKTIEIGELTNRLRNILPIAFLFTFYPAITYIAFGQITGILLLSFVLYLFYAEKKGVCDTFCGGFVLSFTLIKPHLLYVIYIFLFFASVQKKSFRTLLGFVVGTALLSVIALAFHPSIFADYFAASCTPPIYFKTPTVGSWLQEFLGQHTIFVRMLPTALTALAFCVFWIIKGRQSAITCEQIILLTPLSLITSPYGWVFDQILLLPVGLFFIASAMVGAKKRRLFIPTILILTNIAAFLSPLSGMQWSIWYTGIFVALSCEYIVVCKRVGRCDVGASEKEESANPLNLNV